MAETEITSYCEEIGLDVEFLKTVRRMFDSEFNDIFPTWTPIIDDQNKLFSQQLYCRMDIDSWRESAEVDDRYKHFQYDIEVTDQDGKPKRRTIFLSKYDLNYIKKLQDEMKEYVRYQFFRQRRELIKEAEEATNAARVQTGKGSWAIRPLSAADLNRIDKLCQDYTDK